MYHGEYTLQETVILTQLNLNMQARDLERMENGEDRGESGEWRGLLRAEEGGRGPIEGSRWAGDV